LPPAWTMPAPLSRRRHPRSTASRNEPGRQNVA
jgi:hypothetical protein